MVEPEREVSLSTVDVGKRLSLEPQKRLRIREGYSIVVLMDLRRYCALFL